MSSRGGTQDAEEKAGDGVYVTKTRSLFSLWLHGKAVPSRAQPAVVFRSADVIQEGYLLKQGLRLKMWTRRYFILRLEERHMTLGYYTSKDSLTLCAETPIGPGHALGHVKHPRRLELRCGSKVMTLEAEDQKSYDAWKAALQEAIRWNHAMVPSKDGSFVTYGAQASEDLKQEERSRQEAAKKLREKQRADEAAAAANAANKPKYLPATRPGTQCFMTSNTRFEIPASFEYVKTIGSGAYGVVISATDGRTGKTVAVKNIQRAFDDLTDAKRIVREIKLMRHLDHKCVLGVEDIFEPVALDKFEDVYIVSQLMATDMHRVIYSRHALSDEHIAFFMYQMLCAMKYVHSANVIHRDLKPSNVLVNANCELKICDFGLARGVFPEEELELTEYVVTRWYRAPEIMLGCMKYTREVDVWSMGCIFAEMMSRKPLFPGQDYIDQLHLIMNALGAPNDQELYFLTNARARKFMNAEFQKRGPNPTKPLAHMFTDSPPDALDLLQKMLVIDPNKRISVDEALAHPYLASIRNVDDETTATSSFDFDFENEKLTKPVLQRLIWEEMRYFHPVDGEEPGVTANAGEGENDSFATTQASNTPVTPVTPATAEQDNTSSSPETTGNDTTTTVEVSTPATEEARPEDDGEASRPSGDDKQSTNSDQKIVRTSVGSDNPTDAQTRQEAGEPAREVA
ncbi:Extracellular signal-regulated kinase 1 [Phytophthora fragariae]|uniref:Mitogen-activated protein kinase n=1 Tax=Phytophthora fragariae TaxID=53985 RepID=A0A6A3E3M1_9STRA|nr:Extracellular signal-regulated kinase 1 [Phytophthora fragariae]KAE8928175.1 Extracellular signal-regulated kinase 1 [Phytophthora fragariae]KAE8987807.1 Extracellular signal-regulated kinase 1 [Phytophthora fragariae]KAE9086659.1 Extracellular signal-regulated kinase 1 [Phytophthora fragariae]KAE9113969.1 Extracellular signal-regulated kinase 1 [Phytophthora fragariae]